MLDLLKRKLKDEIRQELRQELSNEQPPGPKPCEVFKDYVDDLLKEWQWGHSYRIKQAIYVIARYSCDIDRIAQLTEEQLPNAKKVADEIVKMLYPPDLSAVPARFK